MKLMTIARKSLNKLCRKCGDGFELGERVWKVGQGNKPKYYHRYCKPKEY